MLTAVVLLTLSGTFCIKLYSTNIDSLVLKFRHIGIRFRGALSFSRFIIQATAHTITRKGMTTSNINTQHSIPAKKRSIWATH